MHIVLCAQIHNRVTHLREEYGVGCLCVMHA